MSVFSNIDIFLSKAPLLLVHLTCDTSLQLLTEALYFSQPTEVTTHTHGDVADSWILINTDRGLVYPPPATNKAKITAVN